MHRKKILFNKTNQMHQFHKCILSWNSTCFGQFLCPSLGVYSLYTQQWYMSNRFVDSFRARTSWSCSKAVYKPEAWMFDCCECCVLSGRGFCVGPITRPEESYRLWCVWVWQWNLDNKEVLAHEGLLPHRGKKFYVNYSPYFIVISLN